MKNILITGGTGGIGGNISKMLSDSGNKVTIWGTNEKKYLSLREKCKNKKLLSFSKVNVSSPQEVKKAASKIKKIDILINAAAVLWPVKPFYKLNLEEIKESINITQNGTINTCFYFLKKLKKSKGKIINFSGGGGANARKNHMAYSIAKTAIIRFTENLALENPEIDINVVAPGAHKTCMWKDEKCEMEPEKWGDMNELIIFFKFLLSEEAKGITGKFINYKDDWRNNDFIKKIKEDDDFLTLRRIDDFMFTKLTK